MQDKWGGRWLELWPLPINFGCQLLPPPTPSYQPRCSQPWYHPQNQLFVCWLVDLLVNIHAGKNVERGWNYGACQLISAASCSPRPWYQPRCSQPWYHPQNQLFFVGWSLLVFMQGKKGWLCTIGTMYSAHSAPTFAKGFAKAFDKVGGESENMEALSFLLHRDFCRVVIFCIFQGLPHFSFWSAN